MRFLSSRLYRCLCSMAPPKGFESLTSAFEGNNDALSKPRRDRHAETSRMGRPRQEIRVDQVVERGLEGRVAPNPDAMIPAPVAAAKTFHRDGAAARLADRPPPTAPSQTVIKTPRICPERRYWAECTTLPHSRHELLVDLAGLLADPADATAR
jgi:hypothetical protein